jgi:UDP-3-O-[3-hydroxymyristoyl] glucosamine N-acyltransferase
MRLNEIDKDHGIDVVRDGTFHDLGFAKRRGGHLLMPLYNPRFSKTVYADPNIACVLTTQECTQDAPDHIGVAIVDEPLDVFFNIHMQLVDTDFYGDDFETEIHPTAKVHPAAHVDERRVRIGAGSVVGPKAVVLEGTEMGEKCRIGPGVVIGYEGFEIRTIGDDFLCIPHGGGVRLGDRVDIQANACVAKSLFKEPTALGNDTKVNQLAFVSHGVVVGERCRIAGCSMVAGSTIVGDDVWIGPGARISNGLKISSGAFVTIGSIVTRDVHDKQHVTGNFAVEHQDFIRFMASNFGKPQK